MSLEGISGIVATDVSLEDYLQHYAEQYCEYIQGTVIRLAPNTLTYINLKMYLMCLLDSYLSLRRVGRLVPPPFVMYLPEFPDRRREPDLMIVLNDNLARLKETVMDGPTDIVIEIVSQESVGRDHGIKLEEYQTGKVPEYWIIDPLRQETRFYRLNEASIYIRQEVNAESSYETPALPGLKVYVPTFWLDDLPGPRAISEVVQHMLENTP